jgi:hypothetical protein
LASGGTVSVLVSGIVEWIRNGRGGNRKDVHFAVAIKCADGVELSALMKFGSGTGRVRPVTVGDLHS